MASPCHAAAKNTSLLTLKLFKEGAFSTCLSGIGRVGGKRKPHGPDVRSSLGLGSFGTAGGGIGDGYRSAILAQEFHAFVERNKISNSSSSDRKLCDKFGAELMPQGS